MLKLLFYFSIYFIILHMCGWHNWRCNRCIMSRVAGLSHNARQSWGTKWFVTQERRASASVMTSWRSTLFSAEAIIVPHRMIWSWYIGRWWVGCYIWYSEEETGRGRSPPRPLLAVPNVTAHASTASVPITVLLSVALQFQRAHKRLNA